MNNVYVKLEIANNGKHKYIANVYVNDKIKRVRFGQYGANDYTLNKNYDDNKYRYIMRHIKEYDNGFWDFNITNYTRPSFWSRWLLWNKKTLQESMKDIESKTNIKFI